MALKKEQQKELQFLEIMASRLLQANAEKSLPVVLATISKDIGDFEAATNTILQASIVNDEVKFELVSLSKDFLRLRKPNEEALTLRSKKFGVSIDVKLLKVDDFDHENSYVANALRALASDIDALGFEMSVLGNEDLKEDRIAELRGDDVQEIDDLDKSEEEPEEDDLEEDDLEEPEEPEEDELEESEDLEELEED